MAGGTGDPDGLRAAAPVEEPSDADDGIQLQQLQRHGRVVEVDLPGLDRRSDLLRNRSCIDLETQCKRLFRADPAPDAAEPRAFDGLVEAEHATPDRLVAERVE